ncbi:hypothetical protein [Alkaliphilus sp. B6464]|uniref:hypothetical protein n=1 Tax=Alkaliphilus sp. B6464 TaxID=2731219 RepID=UPI001BA6FCE2|nr:hypothetical protein [Alkaliphilus sp. B6464]QUH20127.1 hypothetical protein HYG84_09550 [Alkaliphilus sp. B6464]
MDAQITIGQLITVLFAIAGGGVLVVLFKTLANLNQIFSNINKIVQRNEVNIDSALNSLPNILVNTEEITKSVNEEMQHVSGAIKAIEETVEYTASAAQVVTEDIVLPVKDILEILALVKSIFIKDKKKGWFEK